MYRCQIVLLSFFCLFSIVSFTFSCKAQTKLNLQNKEHFDLIPNPPRESIMLHYQETSKKKVNGVFFGAISKVNKDKKIIFYENNLQSKFLTFILTFVFFLLIGYIVYKRKTYLVTYIIVSYFFTVALVPISFYTITLHGKELYIRNTGKQIKGKTLWTLEYKGEHVARNISRMNWLPSCYFLYTSEDSIEQRFSGKYTRLDIRDIPSSDGTDAIICLNEKTNEAALLLPRHTQSNISNIIIDTLFLIFVLLFYIGIFDKPLDRWSTKFK